MVGSSGKSRKVCEAEKRGVTIISEDEFMALDPPNPFADMAIAIRRTADD